MRVKNSRKNRKNGYLTHTQSHISAQRMIVRRNALIAVNSSVSVVTDTWSRPGKVIAQSPVRGVEKPSMCGEIEACLQRGTNNENA